MTAKEPLKPSHLGAARIRIFRGSFALIVLFVYRELGVLKFVVVYNGGGG